MNSSNNQILQDKQGQQTLESIAIASRFNKWMYSTISRYTTGSILEIGSGIGNISNFFIEKNANITLSEINIDYIKLLKKQFPKNKAIIMDIADPNFNQNHKKLFNSFDTVYMLNVLEHIKDDREVIKNIKKLLKPNGKLITLVPAFRFLFNSFDQAVGHHKRYTMKSLLKLFRKDFKLIHRQYFNALGIAGWIVSGNIQKKNIIPKNQMKLYDRLIPLAKLIDFFTNKFFGLSIILVVENA